MEPSLKVDAEIGAAARQPAHCLYSDWQVFVATMVGSTLAGGVLLAINFKRLGQSRRAWVALGLGILAVPAAFALGALAEAKNPGYSRSGLALVFALACRWAATGLQGEPYKSNLENGGRRESWWKTLGWGLAGIALLFALGVILSVIGVVHY